MMGRRQKVDAHGLDWVSTRSRHLRNWKAGAGKYVKRRMNKRDRKIATDDFEGI